MKIKILNYTVSIEKQSNSNLKTPSIENVVVRNDNNIEKINKNDMENLIDNSIDLKIGVYVQIQMQILSDNKMLSNEIIKKLQDVSYCKNEFNITFSVLRDKELGVNDGKGYNRYYTNDLYFNNFRLTSQWKEEHREFFLKWLNRQNSFKILNNEPKNYNDILPIELIPNNNEVFLKTLLKTKSATITTFYKNGTKNSKIWNASKLNANSNVIGNLRSRQEYRNGNWQEANIIKVVVEVNNLFIKPISNKEIQINLIEENNMKNDEAIKPSKLKIGKHVQSTFRKAIANIDNNELLKLQNATYSKTTFDIQYPLLKKVSRTNVGKIERYWKEPVEILGDKYWLCSEWFEKEENNDRPYYDKWLKKIGYNN